MNQSTVFIVDDDADLRDALSMLMRAVGLHAASFASGREFLQAVGPQPQGCLVLDIRMPGMGGMELQAELHKRRIALPILFLTGHADVPLAVKAMKAGAVDFIQKPFDEHRLVIAVMNALKTGVAPKPAVADGETAGRPAFAHLSVREREVLNHMLEGRLSREIAEAMCISIKTVEFHRANIREKLGVSSLPELYRLIFSKQPKPS